MECLRTAHSKKSNMPSIPNHAVKLYIGSNATGENNVEEERIVFDLTEHNNGAVALLDVLGRY